MTFLQVHPLPIFLYLNALCRLQTYFQNLHTGKVGHIQGCTPVWFLLWGFYILLTPPMSFIMAGHYSQKGLQRKKDCLYFIIKHPKECKRMLVLNYVWLRWCWFHISFISCLCTERKYQHFITKWHNIATIFTVTLLLFRLFKTLKWPLKFSSSKSSVWIQDD